MANNWIFEIDWTNCPNPVLRLRNGDAVSKWSHPKFRDPLKELDCWTADSDPWYEWIIDFGGSRYVARYFVDRNPECPDYGTVARLYPAQDAYSLRSRAECFVGDPIMPDVADVMPDEDDEWE